MITDIRYAQDIYKAAKGGVAEIALKLKCSPITVERFRYGVNPKYFEILQKEFGISSIALLKYNAKLQGYKAL